MSAWCLDGELSTCLECSVVFYEFFFFYQRRPAGLAPWEKFDPTEQPLVVKPCPPCKHPVSRLDTYIAVFFNIKTCLISHGV